MKTAAFALLLLVAFAYQAEAGIKFCRHSSYKLSCKHVNVLKQQIFKDCNAVGIVKVIGQTQLKNGCCLYKTQWPSEAYWQGTYKVCEDPHPLFKNQQPLLLKAGAPLQLSLDKSRVPCTATAYKGKCKAIGRLLF